MYPSQTKKILHQIACLSFSAPWKWGIEGNFKQTLLSATRAHFPRVSLLLGANITFIYGLVIMDQFLPREVKCSKINKVVIASVTLYFSCIPMKDIYPGSLGRRFLNRSNVLCDSLQKDNFLTLQ